MREQNSQYSSLRERERKSKQVNKKEGIRGQYDGETQDKGTG